jgi:hypothetical protein
MAHLVDKEMVGRAERAVLLTAVGGGLAACVVGALVYDLSLWFGMR